MRTRLTKLCSSVCLLLGIACLLPGQTISTSQINGIVHDPSGLAVPGAEVKVTQTGTGAVRTVTTGADGSYILSSLPVGPYLLEISKDGFNKYVQSGIVLEVGSSPNIDATLKVGSVSEQVVVEAGAALVETHGTGLGQVIDNRRILELPLNGRQATDLIFLAGMSTPGNGANLNSGVRNYPTVQISVAGGVDNGITYVLDGGSHNDPYNNLNLPLPFPDALQEFKVETSGLPAQYGQHSSAAVNGVTKSGTNAFHGDVFEFLRNGVLNARNAFATSRDSLKRNQFGGTFGGPIIKNKLFFFVGEQRTVKRSSPATQIAFIPTQLMLSGDFSAVTAAACNSSNKPLTLPAPFVNNKISPALFSAPSIAMMKFLPTTDNPCGRVQYANILDSNEDLAIARVDFQKSDKHQLFGRYSLARLSQPTDYDGSNALTLSQAGLSDLVHSVVIGDTYLIGATKVSNFRLTVNRSENPKISPNVFDLGQLGVNMFVFSPGSPRVSVTGGFSIGSPSSTSSIYNTTAFQLSEDFSLVRGAHQIAFGAGWLHSILNATSVVNAVAPVTFNGQVTGLGLADFLIGKPSSFQQSSPTSLYYRSNYVGPYVQDSWRVLKRLTVNYGIRWEPFFPQYFKDSRMLHFDQGLFDSNVHSTVYTNAPAGLIFPGDSGYPGNAVANREYNHFSPRIGFALDPKGDGSMSVRASYGLIYNMPNLGHYSGLAQVPPFGTSVTVAFPANFATPWASQAGGNPFPVQLSPTVNFPATGQFVTYPLNPKLTYQNEWNLSLQKQFGTSWLASAAYIGTNVIHLWGGGEIDPAIYIPGASCVLNGVAYTPCSSTANLTQRRRLILQNPAQGKFYGSVGQMDDGGTSNYNGLALSVQRRATKGVTLQANYTWSHCIGDLGNTSMGVAGTNYMIPGNRASSRGNCSSNSVDRRHLFNLSSVYQTPQFSTRMVRVLATGWQVSGIVRIQSGNFLSVTSGVDGALTGSTAERANLILPNPYAPAKNAAQYLNPAAFQAPATGTYGNLGIASIEGPGWVTIDVGLVRNFRIRESQTLQLRGEAFNLPNHTRLDNPTTALNSSTFGKILTAEDPRIVQVAVKYTF